MMLLQTPLHGPIRPLDLGALLRALLAKHSQQYDPPPRRDEIRYPDRITAGTDVEAQLSQLASQLAGVGLIEQRSTLSQQVNV